MGPNLRGVPYVQSTLIGHIVIIIITLCYYIMLHIYTTRFSVAGVGIQLFLKTRKLNKNRGKNKEKINTSTIIVYGFLFDYIVILLLS